MKKILTLALCLATFSSCSVFVPRSANTVNRAPLADLNLDREDYEILNTITAEATINYKRNWNGKKIQLSGVDDDFSVNYKRAPIKLFKKSQSSWICKRVRGIVKVGSLMGEPVPMSLTDPQELAERLALYRAINIANEYGADAIIEPTITVSAEAINRRQVVYKSTVSAKILKLKTDR